MKLISLAIILSIPIAISRVSAFHTPTTELQPALVNETYILHYSHQLHKPILVPVQVETLDDRRTARGVSDQVPNTGGLHRRGLPFQPGFRLTKFKCPSSNREFCDAAKETVKTAFKILEHTLKLKEPVTVKVVFRDSPDEHIVHTTTSHTLGVSDQEKRYLCPTALFNQLHVPWFEKERHHPKWDIILKFDYGTDFYFPSDNRPIQSHEYDLLMIVLHELIHGLGFTSSWKDHHHGDIRGLTPDIVVQPTLDGNIMFTGFVEGFFDQFLIDTSDPTLALRPISNHAEFFQELTRPKLGSVYRDLEELFSDFEKLPGFQERSKFMLDLATRRGSVAFHTRKKGLDVVMDTSLRNVFGQWYSIEHLDSTKYEKTPDFLMVEGPAPGVSLAELIDATGRNGPLGPLVIQILCTLGYTIRNKPKNTKFPLDSYSFWSNYVNNYQMPLTNPTCLPPMKSPLHMFKGKQPMKSPLHIFKGKRLMKSPLHIFKGKRLMKSPLQIFKGKRPMKSALKRIKRAL